MTVSFTEIDSATDWLGNQFTVGQPVLYCIGAGRGQMMAAGVVTAIRSTPHTHTVGRDPNPGETPTRVLTWHDPPRPWVDEEVPYEEITVQVLTHVTSGRWGNEKRTRPAWVNPMNITALEGLHDAVTARVFAAGTLLLAMDETA